MRPRIFISKMLIRVGKFLESLPIVVMRPGDLMEYGCRSYDKSRSCNLEIEPGLSELEQGLLKEMEPLKGRLLLLGIGGGREAIPLAQMGYDVVGVDYIEALAGAAKRNAGRYGVKLETIVGDFTELKFRAQSFDVIWLSSGLYSSIPTRKRRRLLLQKLSGYLKPGGQFAGFFHYQEVPSGLQWRLRKLMAYIFLGNTGYEKGDMLWLNLEFMHAFEKEEELGEEISGLGLKLERCDFEKEGFLGAMLLSKV